MNKSKIILAGLLVVIVCTSVYYVTSTSLLGNKTVGQQPDGSILVPSNQLLRPAGFQIQLPGRPVDLVLSPDEKLLFVKNIASIDLVSVSDRKILQSLPYSRGGSSFTGICISTDGKKLFVTDATNHISTVELDKNNIMHWAGNITMPAPSVGGSPYPGGLALNGTEDKMYVTLSRSNSLAVVNLKDTTNIIQIPVGIAPYDVILASPGKAYVTNWGGRKPRQGEASFNSSGSQALVDPKTGIANSGSVSVIDLDRHTADKSIEVGLHPAGMVLSPSHDKLYVACANSDVISVIDTKTDEVTATISVHMQKDVPFGSAPNALTISPDGKYLYVANGTENAICVIETTTPFKVLGSMPVGWYPGAVLLNKAGKQLYVANVKGVGSRNQNTNSAGYNSHDYLGTVSIIPVPEAASLAKMTTIVHENNFYMQMLAKMASGKTRKEKLPVPQFPTQTSQFKHVVYIIKENRTYDQVFGDMPQGNGDSSLVMFGKEVTPNQHKLAETFVLMDNFNCSGVLSADGHQWASEAYVTDYIEKSFGGFTRSYPYDGNDALAYASSGFIWDNVLKHGLTFRNYGEMVGAVIEPKTAKFTDIYQDFINGTNKISIRAKANIAQLEPYICPTYVGFPLSVSDAYRAAEFLKEFRDYEKNNNFPNFTIMLLPGNHTSGTRPGSQTPKAAVADNDLALGKIIDAISHSKFWKETCIFVVEDDPQAGLDHVDGHRTVGLVISPYTKRGKVVSTYYSQINMVRTMENILGLPPMNQLDLTADPMIECFTNKGDFRPYDFVKSNIPINQMNMALNKIKGPELYWAKKSLLQDLDGEDRIEEDVFNRILWHSVRGYKTPYPVLPVKKYLGREASRDDD